MTSRCRDFYDSRSSRKCNALIQAELLMDKEINMVDFVMQMRYVQAALAELLPKKRLQEIFHKSKFRLIDLD